MPNTYEHIKGKSFGSDLSSFQPEEELEILLHLYGFGLAKGWSFVTLFQVEKLMLNDRINLVGDNRPRFSGSGEDSENTQLGEIILKFAESGRCFENAHIMVDIFMSMLLNEFEKALIGELNYCTKEEWENKTPELKYAVDAVVFYLMYGIELEELPEKIFKRWSTGTG